jgi:hypothetical protein
MNQGLRPYYKVSNKEGVHFIECVEFEQKMMAFFEKVAKKHNLIQHDWRKIEKLSLIQTDELFTIIMGHVCTELYGDDIPHRVDEKCYGTIYNHILKK